MKTAYTLTYLIIKILFQIWTAKVPGKGTEDDRLYFMYNFGCFFGWWKILDNESFLDYSITERNRFDDPFFKSFEAQMKKGQQILINYPTSVFENISSIIDRVSEKIIRLLKLKQKKNINIYLELMIQTWSTERFIVEESVSSPNDKNGNAIPTEKIHDSRRVTRLAFDVIGEMMIKEQQTKGLEYNVITFGELLKNIKQIMILENGFPILKR
jgi:hypothetical protein